eukprot:5125796-Pleurochrysis_carterae.AAC.1
METPSVDRTTVLICMWVGASRDARRGMRRCGLSPHSNADVHRAFHAHAALSVAAPQVVSSLRQRLEAAAASLAAQRRATEEQAAALAHARRQWEQAVLGAAEVQARQDARGALPPTHTPRCLSRRHWQPGTHARREVSLRRSECRLPRLAVGYGEWVLSTPHSQAPQSPPLHFFRFDVSHRQFDGE